MNWKDNVMQLMYHGRCLQDLYMSENSRKKGLFVFNNILHILGRKQFYKCYSRWSQNSCTEVFLGIAVYLLNYTCFRSLYQT